MTNLPHPGEPLTINPKSASFHQRRLNGCPGVHRYVRGLCRQLEQRMIKISTPQSAPQGGNSVHIWETAFGDTLAKVPANSAKQRACAGFQSARALQHPQVSDPRRTVFLWENSQHVQRARRKSQFERVGSPLRNLPSPRRQSRHRPMLARRLHRCSWAAPDKLSRFSARKVRYYP
jgi:hypothetical protein